MPKPKTATSGRPLAKDWESEPPPSAPSAETLRIWKWSVCLSIVLYAGMQGLWIGVTPIRLQQLAPSLPNGQTKQMLVGVGPDEPQHYLYILSIEHTGHVPRPLRTLRRSPSEYVSHEAQHPPLFYIVGALVRSAFRPLGDRVVWYALRGFGAVCGAIAIWLLARAALIALPSAPFVAFATPPFLALLPMYDYMTSELSNYPLELVLTSAGWLMAIEVLRGNRPIDTKTSLIVGGWYGLALLTRQTAVMCLPAVAVIAAWRISRLAAEQRPAGIRAAAAGAAVAIAFTLPWLIYTQVSYGSLMFRSDYRPVLAHISFWSYLANSGQALVVPHIYHVVHCPIPVAIEWYGSTWCQPLWITQFTLPMAFKTLARYQSLYLLFDGIVVVALLQHSYNARRQRLKPDSAARALMWGCALSVCVAVVLVLQQQLEVDIEMFIYAGRYFLSVIAQIALLIVFAISTYVPSRVRSACIAACGLAAVMLAFDLWNYGLMHAFYAPHG